MEVHQHQESALDIAGLLRQIQSGQSKGCQQAQTELKQVRDMALEPLLRRFNSESRRYQRRVRCAMRIGIIGSVLVTLVDLIAIVIAAQGGADAFPFAVIVGMWLLYLITLCAAVIAPLHAAANRKRLRDVLASYDDVRVVGPLAEMLNSQEPELRRTAGKALIHLLPHLTASDASLLNAEQREYLYSVLLGGMRDETDLKVAILKALRQVGDSAALPLVERLAEMSSRRQRQRRVREAARDCLPLLRLRVQQEQSSRTLLRASGPTGTEPESLLRPIADHAQTVPQQLLRPGSGDPF